MKRLLALFAIGFMTAVLTGCEMPPVIFSLPQDTYGYQLDMTDPENPLVVLEPVYLGNEGPFDFIFFTLDDTAPFCWDISDPANPQWANVPNLQGPIPYIDTRPEGGDTDLRTLTAVGTEALFHFPFLVEPWLTTTISAISCNQITGDSSPVASHTYVFDPFRWNGDYTVDGDDQFGVLGGFLLAGGEEGQGIVTIDGNLTIKNLTYSSPVLAVLYLCVPAYSCPGCLETITGDLIVENNPNVTTADIEDMAAAVTVEGSVIHCGNADDDACE